jgi:single-strand DNA-binding protein
LSLAHFFHSFFLKKEKGVIIMASVNKVILVGYLGSDPDLKVSTNTGKAIVSFSVATNSVFKNKLGEDIKSTDWHKVVTWGKQAENCKDYLKKGSKIYLEGRIKNNIWENDQGQKQYSYEIMAKNIRFLSSKPA